MAKSNRKGVKYPKEFMKVMKKLKRKKLRKIPMDREIVEKGMNTASREI